MQMMTPDEQWIALDAMALRARLADGREARRRQAADRRRSATLARLSETQLRREQAAERLHIRQTRKVVRDLGLLAPVRTFGPRIRVREAMRAPMFSAASSRVKCRKAQALPIVQKIHATRQAIVDLKGREAVYLAVTYLGLKSNGWQPGSAAAHARYVHEHDRQWGVFPISNMGSNVDEIASCWDMIETIEQGHRANAKVQMRAVVHLPSDLSFEQMRALAQNLCDREFGRFGLPYSAAIHPPKPGQDNWHLHIDFSCRPFERLGENDWQFAAEKMSGLDDRDGLKALRGRVCGHLNFALHDAGSQRRYTHLSYRERGIKGARRQQHLGLARSAALSAGEQVSRATRNAEQAQTNWAASQAYWAEAKLDAARLGMIAAKGELAAATEARQLAALRRAMATVAAFDPAQRNFMPTKSDERTDPVRASIAQLRTLEQVTDDLERMPWVDTAALQLHHRQYSSLSAVPAAATSTRAQDMTEARYALAAGRVLNTLRIQSAPLEASALHALIIKARKLEFFAKNAILGSDETVKRLASMVAKHRQRLTLPVSKPAVAEPLATVPLDHEVGVIAALQRGPKPTKDHLLDAANLLKQWARNDPAVVRVHFPAWVAATNANAAVFAWSTAYDRADAPADDVDVRARARLVLRDQDAMAQIRANAPILELMIRLSMLADDDAFDEHVANKQSRAAPIENTTMATSRPDAIEDDRVRPVDGSPRPSAAANDIKAATANTETSKHGSGRVREHEPASASASGLSLGTETDDAALLDYIKRIPRRVKISSKAIMLPPGVRQDLLDIAYAVNADPRRFAAFATLGPELLTQVNDAALVSLPQAKAPPLVPPQTFGVRQSSEGSAAALAGKPAELRGPVTPSPAPVPQQPKRVMQMGWHPLFDAYLLAERDMCDDDRRRAAKRIADDPNVRKLIGRLPPWEIKALRDDIDYLRIREFERIGDRRSRGIDRAPDQKLGRTPESD